MLGSELRLYLPQNLLIIVEPQAWYMLHMLTGDSRQLCYLDHVI